MPVTTRQSAHEAAEGLISVMPPTADVLLISAAAATQTRKAVTAGKTYRLCCDEVVWYKIGDATVAAAVETAGSTRVPADAIDYITIHEGTDIGYVSFISASAVKGSFGPTSE